MGKNTRRQIMCRDIFHSIDVMCDSTEECDFIEWCSEAASLGIVKDYQYQPPSIPLFDSCQYTTFDNKKRVLLRDHVYSPDFMLDINPRSYQMLCKAFKLSLQQSQMDSFQVYLDVKGTFQRSDGGRSFSINQKWVYQKTGLYIMKIVPKDFFQKFGCPANCFCTKKTRKLRKMYSGFPSIPQAFQIESKKEAAN